MLGIGEQILIFVCLSYFLFVYLPFNWATSCIFGGICIYYYYLFYEKTYWTRHGVPSAPSHWFFGHSKELAAGMHTYDLKMSKKFDTYGSYIFGKKDLASTNLDFLRKVLVKDFDHFVDKANASLDRYSLYVNALPSKTGDEWKRIRSLVTPAFTTGKLKQLIPTFDHCANELCDYLNEYAKNNENVPLKDVMEKLTINVIARSAFGIEVDAFYDKNSVFLANANKLFASNWSEPHAYFMMLFPNICERIRLYTGHQIIKNNVHKFFKNLLEKMLEERKSDPNAHEKYHDFFQLLLDSFDEQQSNEKIDTIDNDIVHAEISQKSWKKSTISKIEILAQSFVVLLAGYETSATTLHFMLYVLAKLPHIQEKLRYEINDVVGEKGEISYDDLTKLKYLHQVMLETLRMYPPTTRTNRACTKSITIDNISIEEGMSFSIPSYIIHHDERYYPNPYEFDPERFSPEERAKRDPLTFLAFGYGPRNCIGMRFAELEVKTAICHLIRKYRFFPAPGSPDLPLEINSQGMTRPAKKLYVKVEKL